MQVQKGNYAEACPPEGMPSRTYHKMSAHADGGIVRQD